MSESEASGEAGELTEYGEVAVLRERLDTVVAIGDLYRFDRFTAPALLWEELQARFPELLKGSQRNLPQHTSLYAPRLSTREGRVGAPAGQARAAGIDPSGLLLLRVSS